MNKFLGYIIFLSLISPGYLYADSKVSGINVPERDCTKWGFVEVKNDGCTSLTEVLKINTESSIYSKINKSIFDTGNEANIKRRLPVEEDIKEGMIVAFGKKIFSWSEDINLTKSTKKYHVFGLRKAIDSHEAIGVMLASGGDKNKEGVSVLIRGQAYVLLTNENGTVHKGDKIAVSTQRHGYGTKFKDEDYYIGLAQEDESGGKVLTLLQINKYKVNLKDRLISTTSILTTGNTNLNTNGFATMNIKSLYSTLGSWGISRDGRIAEKKLCLDEVCIDRNSLEEIINKNKIDSTVQAVTSVGRKLFSLRGNSSSTQKNNKIEDNTITNIASTTISNYGDLYNGAISETKENKAENVSGNLPQDVFDGSGFINP